MPQVADSVVFNLVRRGWIITITYRFEKDIHYANSMLNGPGAPTSAIEANSNDNLVVTGNIGNMGHNVKITDVAGTITIVAGANDTVGNDLIYSISIVLPVQA